LKNLVQKDLAVSADTNRVVHKMRRAARWGTTLQFVWWAVVIAVSGAAYYYYLDPYVKKIEHLYANVQTGQSQVQTWEQQAADFFKKLTSSPQPSSPQVPQNQ
jgi:uncharacterized membrane protein